MTGTEFLTALWGAEPPGYVLVWDLLTKKSRFSRKPVPVPPGSPDVYTGVGLAHKSHGTKRRTRSDEVIAIPGLWADVDVSPKACPTWDDAETVVRTLAEPTILVHSGAGLHAWWLFDVPWRFRTRGDQRLAARAVAQWQKLLRERSGFPLDYTHDLARVLRLPGTDNAKRTPHHPVEVIETGPRHERDELIEIAALAGEVDAGYTLGCPQADVRLAEPGNHDPRVAEHLYRVSPQFALLWHHKRALPSLSEYDFALGHIVALAGGSDQQIADTIAAHRAYWNDPKGGRYSYLSRTVGKIRAGAA